MQWGYELRVPQKDASGLFYTHGVAARKCMLSNIMFKVHSSLLKATRNRRVTFYVAAKRFGDIISGIPFIRPNLKQ